jgi:hypothetical protein
VSWAELTICLADWLTKLTEQWTNERTNERSHFLLFLFWAWPLLLLLSIFFFSHTTIQPWLHYIHRLFFVHRYTIPDSWGPNKKRSKDKKKEEDDADEEEEEEEEEEDEDAKLEAADETTTIVAQASSSSSSSSSSSAVTTTITEGEDEKKNEDENDDDEEEEIIDPIPVYVKARELFNDHEVNKAVKLNWVECKSDELRLFLVKDMGFQLERVNSNIEKLKKAHNANSKPQARMDSFFKKVAAPNAEVLEKKRKAEKDAKSKSKGAKKVKGGEKKDGGKKGGSFFGKKK